MRNKASVAQIKARLSEYLRQVKSGEEVLITERGMPVARIVPLDDGERRETRRSRLVRAGVLRSGKGGLRKELRTPPRGAEIGRSVVDALIAERSETDR
jgi:prevent-host-death family protein